jgi:hypothetical protein
MAAIRRLSSLAPHRPVAVKAAHGTNAPTSQTLVIGRGHPLATEQVHG